MFVDSFCSMHFRELVGVCWLEVRGLQKVVVVVLSFCPRYNGEVCAQAQMKIQISLFFEVG